MPTPTFADVADDPALQALTIDIHAFGEVTTKEWVKTSMEASRWKRILTIAETSAGRLVADPGRGYSWVTAVVIDGEAITLALPEHLRDLVAVDPR